MPRPDPLIDRILNSIATCVVAKPKVWVSIAIFAAILSGVYAFLFLEMDTDQNDLVSNELEYNKRYLSYLEEFGDQEHLFVVIQTDDIDLGKKIAREVSDKIKPLIEAGDVEECLYRLDLSGIDKNSLLLLDPQLVEALTTEAIAQREVLQALLANDQGLTGFISAIHSLMKVEGAPNEQEASKFELGLNLLNQLLEAMRDAVKGKSPGSAQGESSEGLSSLLQNPQFQSLLQRDPWKDLIDPNFLIQASADGYFFFGDLCFVMIMPSKDYETLEVIREPLRKIREILASVRTQYPDVPIGLTGRPVLQADEMMTTEKDMTLASIIALGAVLLLFMLFFKAVRRPILTGCVLLIGLGITFGLVTLFVGHLNLLSMVFAVMLVSLGTDFGVHIIARYQEELASGKSIYDALLAAQVHAGRSNLTGATTTAAAFYTTLLIDFKGLAELGFIAGTGVLVCMLVMNFILPAVVLLVDQRALPKQLAPIKMSFLKPVCQNPVDILGFFIAMILLGVGGLWSVRFNSNLLELQAEDLDSVQYEKIITQNEGIKTWYATYLVDDLESLKKLVAELKKPEYASVIQSVETVFDTVPLDQEARKAKVENLATALRAGQEKLSLQPLPKELSLEDLSLALEDLLDRLEGYLSGALRAGQKEAQVLERPIDLIDELMEAMEEEAQAQERLRQFEKNGFEWISGILSGLTPFLTPTQIQFEDLDPFLRQRLKSENSGRYIAYAYPAKDIWQEDHMEEFIRVTESIDPEVTGVPAQVFHSTLAMKHGFLLAALYSLIAVVILIGFDFKNVLYTVLALIPVVVGMFITLEWMPRVGLDFNLANFFAIPIIIGTGINGGVHFIHRYRELTESQKANGEKSSVWLRATQVATSSTGTSVVLSELITAVALGMLLIAHHKGMASLGGLLVLGCLSCLFASLFILLPLLSLLQKYQESKNENLS